MFYSSTIIIVGFRKLYQRVLPATPRIVIASGYLPELEAKAVTTDKDFAETGTPSARPPARIVTVINPGIGVCVHGAIGAEYKDIEVRRQPC